MEGGLVDSIGNSEGVENTSGIPKERGGKGVWNSKCMGGGGAFWNFRMHGGGGKISMPPVVGVRIFSGTTHLTPLDVRGLKQLLLFSLSFSYC